MTRRRIGRPVVNEDHGLHAAQSHAPGNSLSGIAFRHFRSPPPTTNFVRNACRSFTSTPCDNVLACYTR